MENWPAPAGAARTRSVQPLKWAEGSARAVLRDALLGTAGVAVSMAEDPGPEREGTQQD